MKFSRVALRAALVLSACLALVLPGPASAADSFTFHGLGYGHGVGMSQWGAWAAAREGRDFAEILAFYYEGTDLSTLSPGNPEMVVRLSSEPNKSVSAITQNFSRVDVRPAGASIDVALKESGGERVVEVAEGGLVSVQPRAGSGVVVLGPFGEERVDEVAIRPHPSPYAGPLFEVTFHSGGSSYGPRHYRGKLAVRPSATAGYLGAYNYVSLEGYVRAIAEVIPSWARDDSPDSAFEAVKAQAVAARTYGLANRSPYLNDNQWDQVYRGYDFEVANPGIRDAAEETRDRVLRYGGEIISAFFSSNSGGYTTVWGSSPPAYLRAKPDPWSLAAPTGNPGYVWSHTVGQAELSAKVRDRFGDLGTVTSVTVESRDTADVKSHAKTLLLQGTKGAEVVDAEDFRRIFGYSLMRSTLFTRIDAPGFSDVPSTHLYYDEITEVAHSGLVGGYPDGSFRPHSSASRWQFAKMAVGLHNSLFPGEPIDVIDVSTPPFADVPVRSGVEGDESDWVSAAKGAGLVLGVDAQRFLPYQAVRRDQVATMLVRALGLEDEAAALPPEVPGFLDLPPDSPHERSAALLRDRGILHGYEEPAGSGRYYLHPDEEISRMHIAALLSRVLSTE